MYKTEKIWISEGSRHGGGGIWLLEAQLTGLHIRYKIITEIAFSTNRPDALSISSTCDRNDARAIAVPADDSVLRWGKVVFHVCKQRNRKVNIRSQKYEELYQKGLHQCTLYSNFNYKIMIKSIKKLLIWLIPPPPKNDRFWCKRDFFYVFILSSSYRVSS